MLSPPPRSPEASGNIRRRSRPWYGFSPSALRSLRCPLPSLCHAPRGPWRPSPARRMENTSSTGIRKGLSTAPDPDDVHVHQLEDAPALLALLRGRPPPRPRPVSPAQEEPLITGMSSPGKLHSPNSSRTSISTSSSSSSSSTWSVLFMNTTIYGNSPPGGPEVCAPGSGASGCPPKIPPGSPRPSAAPVIMFFT